MEKKSNGKPLRQLYRRIFRTVPTKILNSFLSTSAAKSSKVPGARLRTLDALRIINLSHGCPHDRLVIYNGSISSISQILLPTYLPTKTISPDRRLPQKTGSVEFVHTTTTTRARRLIIFYSSSSIYSYRTSYRSYGSSYFHFCHFILCAHQRKP
ncbi:unnamed protein product, partial [Trichogramma brassicae]